MAVVRILAGSASFNALDYNSQRANKGQAEFLVQRNFHPIFSSKVFNLQCFKQYLQIWSDRNSRIKNSQFHVAISAKGKSLTKQQLQNIGERWLHLMGYSNNPYCIFFHHNTRNNHIHIVTTRVDPNGKKINDKFEKARAVQVLDRIMGHDRVAENRVSVANFLKFSCSNRNQFFSVLEDNGFRIKGDSENASFYQLYKNGQFICMLQADMIKWCNDRYYKNTLTEDKRKRIKALLLKYANRSGSFLAMNELLRKHHGLSLVLYGGKNGKEYYGYSVIDYKNHCVYKGGEFLNIRFLNRIIQQQPMSKDEALQHVRSSLLQNPALTIKELNAQTAIKGSFYVTKDGIIVSRSNLIIGELDDDLLSAFRYNNVVKFCNDKYHPVTSGECDWIASHYHINSDDFAPYTAENRLFRENDIKYYEKALRSMLTEENLSTCLGEAGYRYSKFHDEYIFYDEENEKIFSADVLSADLSAEVDQALEYNYSSSLSGDSSASTDTELFDSLVDGIAVSIDALSANNAHISVGGGSSNDDDNKRKKKKK